MAVTQPVNGSVTFTATGVTYTPRQGYKGTDTFTYTVSDGYGGSDTATVIVTVAAGTPNRLPVARNDRPQGTATPGVPMQIAVLVNDSDPDGDPLTVKASTTPTTRFKGKDYPAGSTRIADDGKSVWLMAGNLEGTVTFTYTISDGRGGESTATVTVYVSNGG